MKKFKVAFTLDVKQKRKLIEILLIVGSLLAALRLPTSWLPVFMLFIIFSLIYFVHIQQKQLDAKRINFFAVVVASSFSGSIIYYLGIGLATLIKNLPYSFELTMIISFGYYFIVSLFIYKALSIDDKTAKKKKNPKKIKKIEVIKL